MIFRPSYLALCICSVCTLVSADDNATINTNSDLEVITVQGDYRQHNLLKSANALSVLTENDISDRNAQNLEEIIAIAPNVNFSSGSQRARYYQIRGVGERSQFQEPINPSVGLIIDDVDFTGIGSVASMFDVRQVEIYRGPQGTRFGANAMAGLINLSTNAPTDNFEGNVKLTAGNYGSLAAGVALSGPVNDAVKYRFAVEQYESNGFIENSYLSKDDTNDRDELSMRTKLAIQASDVLLIDVALFHFDFDNGYDAFSLDNTRETLSDQPGVDQQKTTAASIKFTYQGFGQFDLISILSSADSDLTYGYDEDWSFEGIREGWEYSSTDFYFRDRETITAEVRLVSNKPIQLFNYSTSWVTGVYVKQDDEALRRKYTYLTSDFNSIFETETLAVFGQLDSQLNEKLSLIFGLRVEQRDAAYVNTNALAFSPSETLTGGKLVLSYQKTDDSMFYGSINRGYKASGVNTDGTLPDHLRQFDAEYLWNYELGYKVSLLNNQAYLRAAIFYMDRQDMQVKTFQTVTRDDNTSEFVAYLGNAAQGYNRGIELEAAWQLTDTLELHGSLGLLETELEDYINAEGEDLSGRDQAHAPEYQFSAGVNYQPTELWLMNIALEGKDSFYFSDSHDQQSESMSLVHASVSYLEENWQMKVWARNLLDKDYATRGFYFGNDPRDGYTAKTYSQLGEPVVFGATFTYRF